MKNELFMGLIILNGLMIDNLYLFVINILIIATHVFDLEEKKIQFLSKTFRKMYEFTLKETQVSLSEKENTSDFKWLSQVDF